MILHTSRLTLRPWREEDAEACEQPTMKPDAEICRQSDEAGANPGQGLTDTPIGAISLKLNGHTDMTERDDECELGYWLGKPFWGRGYMPEAAQELLRHGFEDLGMTTMLLRLIDERG